MGFYKSDWCSEPIKHNDEKSIDCRDAIVELQESLKELYSQKFDNVVTQWENALSRLEHKASVLEERISRSEEQGQIVSANYYTALIANEEKKQQDLIKQRNGMLNALNAAVASGAVTKGSEEWSRMIEEINGVNEEIEESKTQIIEWNNEIRNIEWETFDLLQDRISRITSEAEYLRDLMSIDKLYDEDTGALTNEGMATMGLNAQDYVTNMKQAEDYGNKVAEMQKQLAATPSLAKDQDFIDQMNEYIDKQQEFILAANDSKEAIRDMVEEGINLELEALQERIDKYNEALDSQKELYDYQKQVKEQTKEIASLEKQMAAYAGDTSEEAKAKIQELKVSLEEAKDSLEETEYDKYISDQGEMLDDLYEEYEELLNERLDNIDALVSDMIEATNNNADTIASTIESTAEEVGYVLSSELSKIWNSSGKVVSDNPTGEQTTTGTVVDGVKVQTGSANTSTYDAGNTKYASGTAYDNNGVVNKGDKVNLKSTNGLYTTSKGNKKISTKPKKTKNLYVTNVYPKNKNPYQISATKTGFYDNGDSSVIGWVRNKNNLEGYATGAKNISEDEIAWTQEQGQEFIIRPSDNAILTPLAKGDSILNANASGNIWDMANNPSDFIRDNLGLGDAPLPSSGNVSNTVVTNLDNITFNLPGVTDYNGFKKAITKDPDFERFIKAITLDKLVGGSSLAKGKSIRR